LGKDAEEARKTFKGTPKGHAAKLIGHGKDMKRTPKGHRKDTSRKFRDKKDLTDVCPFGILRGMPFMNALETVLDTQDNTDNQPSSVAAAVIKKLILSAEAAMSLAMQIEECFEEIERAQRTYTLEEIANALQEAGIEITKDYLSKTLTRIRKKRGIVKHRSKNREVPKDHAKPVFASPAKTPAAASLGMRQGDFDRNTGRDVKELF
jgi:hypothetical protein